MSIARKGRKSASSKSLNRNYPKGLVLPEREIRDLAGNLRIREAQRAAMCLLIVDKAARAISEDKTESGEVNLRLIKEMADEEKCRQIRRIIRAIIAAIEHGADGVYAARLTITRFIELAFENQPDPNRAEGPYNNKLRKIRRAA
ncbi:MAG: hypothetical protein AABN33_10480 [Acidobacteriota bacterium]